MTLDIGSANTVSQHIPDTKSSTGATINIFVEIGDTDYKVKTNEKEDASHIPLTSAKKSPLFIGDRIFLSFGRPVSTEKTIILAIVSQALNTLTSPSPLRSTLMVTHRGIENYSQLSASF